MKFDYEFYLKTKDLYCEIYNFHFTLEKTKHTELSNKLLMKMVNFFADLSASGLVVIPNFKEVCEFLQ